MNRKARHTSPRSLGTAGISILFASLVVCPRTIRPKAAVRHLERFRRSRGLDAVLIAQADR